MVRNTAVLIALFVLLQTTTPAVAQIAPDAQKIAAVADGAITVAKASWWGFDPDDSTAALQSAIDSGVPKLIVDKMAGSWIVTPIVLAGDQEIVFEKGVEVLAKRGAFKGGGDSLFRASNKENITLSGYGATWRMWRDDYDNPELYEKAEWPLLRSGKRLRPGGASPGGPSCDWSTGSKNVAGSVARSMRASCTIGPRPIAT